MKYGEKLFEPRMGVCLHFDGSANDRGSVAWLRDPKCEVSYNLIVLDNGTVERIAPDDKRAYHAGECKSSDPRLPYKDANSAFYGLAIAATDGDTCTPLQFSSVVRMCAGYFLKHGWKANETWRIVGHETEAWPRGRKHDPTGSDATKPVLDVSAVRSAVRTILEESI